MTPRMNLHKSHRLGMAAVLGLEAYSRTHVQSGLYELVQLRASILNQCRYCIDVHTKALTKRGETPERIQALHDTNLDPAVFEPREIAALRLTDAETHLADGGVPDEVWAEAGKHFTDSQLGDLVIAIATINVWNRIGVTTRMQP